MKTKTLLRLRSVLILLFLATVVGVGFYFLALPKLNQDKPIILADDLFGWKYPSVKFPITGPEQLAYSDIRDPGGIPQGLPVRLQVPIIGVDAAIEDALITPDGRMDVPQGSVNVAWFALGPRPGQIGSAVIGGHFGIQNGVPFVFYKLDHLKVGDKIYVIDDKGDTLAFIVRKIQLFDRNADATDVFISNDGLAHLNLITCEGIWNQVNGSYPQRRVVFTDAIPTEGVVIPVVQPVTASVRSLSLGDKGTEVASLQTSLEQKGFLVMPRGIAKGYFGVLTHAAVAKFQSSVGLSQTGIFDSLTRTNLLSAQPASARSLSLGDEGADVASLQTSLEQKEFLVIPRGIAKGYFGVLTRAAVAKFQLSVGLPQTGIFDSLTRTRFLSTPIASVPALPTASLTSQSPAQIKTPYSSQAFTQSIKSLYATPKDGLITSALLLLIAFMMFKIIKKK